MHPFIVNAALSQLKDDLIALHKRLLRIYLEKKFQKNIINLENKTTFTSKKNIRFAVIISTLIVKCFSFFFFSFSLFSCVLFYMYFFELCYCFFYIYYWVRFRMKAAWAAVRNVRKNMRQICESQKYERKTSVMPPDTFDASFRTEAPDRAADSASRSPKPVVVVIGVVVHRQRRSSFVSLFIVASCRVRSCSYSCSCR